MVGGQEATNVAKHGGGGKTMAGKQDAQQGEQVPKIDVDPSVILSAWLNSFFLALPGGWAYKKTKWTRIKLGPDSEHGLREEIIVHVDSLVAKLGKQFDAERGGAIIARFNVPDAVSLYEFFNRPGGFGRFHAWLLENVDRLMNAVMKAYGHGPVPVLTYATGTPQEERDRNRLAMRAPFQQWFAQFQDVYKNQCSKEERLDIANAIREFLASAQLKYKLLREAAKVKEQQLANAPAQQAAKLRMFIDRGIMVLEELDGIFKLYQSVLEAHQREQSTYVLDPASLLIAMWWWFHHHLPGEAGSADKTRIPLAIPGMDVSVHAIGVWLHFGAVVPIDLEGFPVTEGYEGHQLWVEVPGLPEMWPAFSKNPQVDAVLRLREARHEAEVFMNELMDARGQPVSPLEKARQSYKDAGVPEPGDLLLRVVEETQAWYQLVLEVFRVCQDEQERGARIFRPLLASIMVSLSLRGEALRRAEESLRTEPPGTGADLRKRQADIEKARQSLDALNKELEFFLQMLCVWEWEWEWILLLRGSPILRFLPMLPAGGRRRQRDEEDPGDPDGPDGPDGPEGPEEPDGPDGPAEEDLWADIADVKELDLTNPAIRGRILQNKKFWVYVVRLRAKRISRPLGWFGRNNWLIFYVRSLRGTQFACLVSPEQDHADYWLRIDPDGLWLDDCEKPRWKLRMAGEEGGQTLVRDFANPRDNKRVIHDPDHGWVEWLVKYLEEN